MPSKVAPRSFGARLGSVLLTIFTFVLVILWAVPMAWAVVASLRPPTDPLGRGDVWFAFPLTLENYARALTLAPFGQYYVNTVVVILMILTVQMVTVTLAAFAFAHYDFRGKRVLFYLVLLQLMIPTTALLAPNFSTIRFLGLFDTRLAIAIPYFGSAFGTFLLRQLFLEIPRDLVDAGVMDGCRWWQLLRHIYLPPAVPTLIAFGLSSTAWHWNEFLWPLVITNSDKARPLTAGLVRFTQLGEIGAQWALLSAATLIVILPLFVVFLFFQKRFIQSFVYSGIK
ncbi:MAG: carbohydrate ABC transporter permease [Caldilinea sp.]|nr:carbohydrate ABC transporter permease [Caldilinea sp.]MCB9115661.1 carbohydrate ABC transporter permease [Caldilineaceae bacterium]MCB0054879.1 carbohydrate ABC transporter permease [Caldilinea sp.]MCB9121147.1 carbohydrate ABC transporter permease [Caldilineaceae bacterium]MCB9123225.1 carbohydrate ABC transporter permease [Caldilineaceae bacterium]